MKKLGYKYPENDVLKSTFEVIMSYIKGDGNLLYLTEKARQYYTWGATKFKYIVNDDGCCYGIQFNVTGILHKGRVRIYYNVGTDLFDIELLRPRKDEIVWECDDIDFMQLHNVLHQHIERTDDAEV